MFDNYIFVKPGFLRGAARALDVGGVLGREAFRFSRTPADADQEALASDWQVVGQDLASAMQSLGLETSKAGR